MTVKRNNSGKGSESKSSPARTRGAAARNTKNADADFRKIRDELQQGLLRPVYLLYGDEPYLIEKLTSAISKACLAEQAGTLDLAVLRGPLSSLDLDRVMAEVRTPPFLSPRRLTLVRNSGWFGVSRNNANETENEPTTVNRTKSAGIALTDLIGAIPDSACLVFIEAKVDRRQKQLLNAIEAQGGVIGEMSTQTTDLLLTWITGESRRAGFSVDRDAAMNLIERCDGQMQLIWLELEKQFLYGRQEGRERIRLAEIDLMAPPDLRGRIFDLTDALAAGHAAQAILLADTLIGQKQPIQLIIFLLARQFRQMIVALDLRQPAEIASRLRCPPFVASRLRGQVTGLSFDLLEELYALCQDTDVQIKTGRIQERLGLELLLAAAAGRIQARRGSGNRAPTH